MIDQPKRTGLHTEKKFVKFFLGTGKKRSLTLCVEEGGVDTTIVKARAEAQQRLLLAVGSKKGKSPYEGAEWGPGEKSGKKWGGKSITK